MEGLQFYAELQVSLLLFHVLAEDRRDNTEESKLMPGHTVVCFIGVKLGAGETQIFYKG